MKFIFSVALSLHCIFSFSQSGNFFLSNHSPGEERSNNICFQSQQHPNGIMYFATRSGILEFDGRVWSVINGTGAVYTLAIDDKGTIFWGGAYGYGVVSGQESNMPEMKVLSSGIRDVFHAVHHGDKVYFLSDQHIYIVDPTTHKQEGVIDATDASGSFTSLFEIGDDIVAGTSRNGIYTIAEGKLSGRPVNSVSSQIVFASRFKDQTLLGTANNEILIAQQGKSFKKVTVQDQQFLNDGVITSGSWVSDDLVVLGTLRGGLIFINLANGRTHEIINYSTGLPDNEIFAVTSDKTHCVWAAHEYGFTRVAPNLPFRTFSYYPGLEGNLLCAVSFGNSVYVGTSIGLYKLEKEDVYTERSYYVSANGKEKNNSDGEAKASGDVEQKKKGFFQLFKKRTSPPAEEDGKSPDAEKKRNRKMKTEKVLLSSSYRYKKVKNVHAKITRLNVFGNRLVACGLGGTYEIEGLTGSLLLPDPARFIYGTSDNLLFISTYSDEVKTLRHNGRSWVKTDHLKNVTDQITHIFEESKEVVWLCALDKVYRLNLGGTATSGLKVIEVENPNYDELIGIQSEGKIILANSNGLYSLNESQDTFQKVDSLTASKFTNYFSGGGSLWYRDIHGWNILSKERSSRNVALLNLFQNIRFINPDTRTENLWLITDDNRLYKYFSDRVNLYTQGFPVVLKTVRTGELRTGGGKKLKIDQENSRLTFEVVQPEYLAAEAVEYRYRITGLKQDWTDWSQTNNVIEIPYLPAGDYAVDVEARDIFGNISSLETIALDVLPPYWKTTWFYALEVLVFSLLVVLSFRLSVRYRIISRLLMLLTIIMLIQFVETIIGDTLSTKDSPVVDFLIQVLIAMLVLPVEGYLRELMLRSLDTNHRFYRFIAPKATVPREPQDES